LNTQVLQDIKEIDFQITDKENNVKIEINRLKNEGITADIEYDGLMSEIDKCKEQLRQQRYNNDIRHKYIYQNLMSDKIDFCHRPPNLKINLPPRKTLGGNMYDYEVGTAPNDYFEKPCKFDFDYGHLVSSRSQKTLDTATLSLGTLI
jgi:hypothetical protein